MDQIKQKIAAFVETKSLEISKEYLSGFYIFYSFDLVNSTKYKVVSEQKWPVVIRTFYNYIEQGFKKRTSNVRLWKYVGDEVLLCKRVSNIKELYESVQTSKIVLDSSIEHLHSTFPETKTILSVKATIWCADVLYCPPQDFKSLDSGGACFRNIAIDYITPSGEEGFDFLGPEIDEGFRVSKYTVRSRLVVSADLAYLIFRERSRFDGIEEKFKIVEYKSMKGIWGERRYPVIWYEVNWVDILKSFYYDEHFESDVIGKVLKKEIQDIKMLEKIYLDINRKSLMEDILKRIVEMNEDDQKDVPIKKSHLFNMSAEVHCVAVVLNSDGKVLIGKRKKDKRRYPDCWEFGCGQLEYNESFEECLSRNYMTDFNIQLDYSCLVPLRQFIIDDKDEHRKIPGIIFIAEAIDGASASSNKHEDIYWIDVSEVDEWIKTNSVVPEFDETIKKAHEVWFSCKGALEAASLK